MENRVPQNTPIPTVRSTLEDSHGDNYTCFEFSPQHEMEIWNGDKKNRKIFKSFNQKAKPQYNTSKRNANPPFNFYLPSISVTNLELKKENGNPNSELSFSDNIRKKRQFKKEKLQSNTLTSQVKNGKRTVITSGYNNVANVTDETKKKVLFIEAEMARMHFNNKNVYQTTKSAKNHKKFHQVKQTHCNKTNINSLLNKTIANQLPNINLLNKNLKQNTSPNQSRRNNIPFDFSKLLPNNNKFSKKLYFKTLPKITNKSKLQRIAQEQKILIEENKKLSEENRRLHMEKLELLTENLSKEKLNDISPNEFTNEVVNCLKNNLESYPRKYEVPINKISNSDIIQFTTDIFPNKNLERKKWHCPISLPLQSTESQQSISNIKMNKINNKTNQFITSLEELNQKRNTISKSCIKQCENNKNQCSVIKRVESKPKMETNHLIKYRPVNYKSIEYYENSFEKIDNPIEAQKRVTFNEQSNIQWIEKVNMKQNSKETTNLTNNNITNEWIEKLNNITDNQKLESDKISVIYQKSPRLTENVLAVTSSAQNFQNSSISDHVKKSKFDDVESEKITELETSNSQYTVDEILSNASNILHRLNVKEQYENNEDSTAGKYDNMKNITSETSINQNIQALSEISCNTEFNDGLSLSPRSAKLLSTLKYNINDHNLNLLTECQPKSTNLYTHQNKSINNEFKVEYMIAKNQLSSEKKEFQNILNPKDIKNDKHETLFKDNNNSLKSSNNITDEKIPMNLIHFSTIKDSKQFKMENYLKNEEISGKLLDSRIVRKQIFINPSLNNSVEDIHNKQDYESSIPFKRDSYISSISTKKDLTNNKIENSLKNKDASINLPEFYKTKKKVFINQTPNNSFESIYTKNNVKIEVPFQNDAKEQDKKLNEVISTNIDFVTETSLENQQTIYDSIINSFSENQTKSQISTIDVKTAIKIKERNAKLTEENKILHEKLYTEQNKNKQLELAKNRKQKNINKSLLELFTERKAKEFVNETMRLNKFNRRVEKVINRLEETNSSFMDFYNNKKKTENITEKKREPLIGVYNELLKTSTDDFVEAEKLFTPLMSIKDSTPKLPNINHTGHGDHEVNNDYFTRSVNLIKLATSGERSAECKYFNTRSQKKNLSIHFNNSNPYSSTSFWENSNLPQISTLSSKYIPKHSKIIVKNSQKDKFPSIHVTELKNDTNNNAHMKCHNFLI